MNPLRLQKVGTMALSNWQQWKVSQRNKLIFVFRNLGASSSICDAFKNFTDWPLKLSLIALICLWLFLREAQAQPWLITSTPWKGRFQCPSEPFLWILMVLEGYIFFRMFDSLCFITLTRTQFFWHQVLFLGRFMYLSFELVT